MKVENIRYVLTRETDGETVYLNDYPLFVNDIRCATLASSETTAMLLREEYEEEVEKELGYKAGFYKSNLTIIPVKITYEW